MSIACLSSVAPQIALLPTLFVARHGDVLVSLRSIAAWMLFSMLVFRAICFAVTPIRWGSAVFALSRQRNRVPRLLHLRLSAMIPIRMRPILPWRCVQLRSAGLVPRLCARAFLEALPTMRLACSDVLLERGLLFALSKTILKRGSFVRAMIGRLIQLAVAVFHAFP